MTEGERTTSRSLALAAAMIAAWGSFAVPMAAQADVGQWQPRGGALVALVIHEQPSSTMAPLRTQPLTGGRSIVAHRSAMLGGDSVDPFEESDGATAAPEMPPTDSTPTSAPAEQFDPFEDAAAEASKSSASSSTPPGEVEEKAPAEFDPFDAPDGADKGAEDAVSQELVAPPVEEHAAAPLAEETADSAGVADEVVAAPASQEDLLADQETPEQKDERWRMEAEQDAPQEKPRPEPTAQQKEQRRKQIETERARSAKDCDEVFNEVKSKGITSVNLNIRMAGNPGEDYPFDCALGDEQFSPRNWEAITYRWKASGLCHKPLYFQEASLERYGHTWGPVLQPFVSGAHFFFTVPMLPYAMGIQTPNECVYTLGYYRPGSCAPRQIEPLPFTWRAAAFETGVVTGLWFIIP